MAKREEEKNDFLHVNIIGCEKVKLDLPIKFVFNFYFGFLKSTACGNILFWLPRCITNMQLRQ